MTKSRKDVRLERYRYAKSLGYTAKEARQYRDYSSQRIEKTVRADERRLEATPVDELSERDIDKLTRIRKQRKIERQEPERRGRIEPESERLRNFKYWTKRKSFPSEIQKLISKTNTDNGYDEYDSYGYRIFYHLYVKEEKEQEAIKIVETTNT